MAEIARIVVMARWQSRCSDRHGSLVRRTHGSVSCSSHIGSASSDRPSCRLRRLLIEYVPVCSFANTVTIADTVRVANAVSRAVGCRDSDHHSRRRKHVGHVGIRPESDDRDAGRRGHLDEYGCHGARRRLGYGCLGLGADRAKREFRVYIHRQRNVCVSLLDPPGDEGNNCRAVKEEFAARASEPRTALTVTPLSIGHAFARLRDERSTDLLAKGAVVLCARALSLLCSAAS